MSEFKMDWFRLDGKVAWVTGATDGIGFAMAVGLAKAGAKIAFNGRNVINPKASTRKGMSAM